MIDDENTTSCEREHAVLKEIILLHQFNSYCLKHILPTEIPY